MTFTYRHRKQIIISCIILTALLLVIGSIFLFQRNFKKSQKTTELVLNTTKNEKKEHDKETSKEEEYYQIDIKGEINSPGIYTVKEGSRVIDVIRLAGDLTTNADTSVLNLAKKVKDEMVIIVYSYAEVADFTKTKEIEKQQQEACVTQSEVVNNACIETTDKEEASSSSSSKISLNNATLEELMTLPGIGETKAKAIIDYRNEVGSFQNIEQLKEVNGIGESTFDQIKENITL